MTHNIHEFVPPSTPFFFNAENAQNPAWKHVEKTNNIQGIGNMSVKTN